MGGGKAPGEAINHVCRQNILLQGDMMRGECSPASIGRKALFHHAFLKLSHVCLLFLLFLASHLVCVAMPRRRFPAQKTLTKGAKPPINEMHAMTGMRVISADRATAPPCRCGRQMEPGPHPQSGTFLAGQTRGWGQTLLVAMPRRANFDYSQLRRGGFAG